ncbi:MAG: HAD-superfamily hydrolase, subfamily variant 3 [Firmicutes bacterium]|nr:HAD-superfamily hydrolase, subfamily variant 3 [Bacillota bacterium]
MYNKFDACIFDLDGTLINSLEDLAASTNYALKKLGFPSHNIDNYRYFIGHGVTKLLEVTLPEDARIPEVIDKARKLFDEYYSTHYLDTTKPYDGIIMLIDELREKDLKLAVVSNKPHNYVEKIINSLFSDKFDTFLGQRPGVPRKPDPTGIFDACLKLGVKSENCLYLGDSGLDMQTAVAAGAFPLGVLWGFRDRNELESYGAKAVISNPAELLEII